MSTESVAIAMQSKNLAWSELATRSIDWIAALGTSGIRDPLPAQVARLLAGDNQCFWTIVATIERKVARKAKLTPESRLEIFAAVYWWLMPACRDCVAGHCQILDTPMLHEADCMTCGGTGLAPHLHTGQTYAMTLRYLEVASVECGNIVKRKIA